METMALVVSSSVDIDLFHVRKDEFDISVLLNLYMSDTQ